jgi:hypothetical protein
MFGMRPCTLIVTRTATLLLKMSLALFQPIAVSDVHFYLQSTTFESVVNVGSYSVDYLASLLRRQNPSK